MPYYVVKDGQRLGPLSDEEFQSRVLSGEVGPDTLVWKPGMTDWRPYAEHAGLQEMPAGGGAGYGDGSGGICAECGRSFGPDDLVSIAGATVCASCKPLFVQRMREGASLPGAMRYGGFWIRFVAKMVDNVILYVLNFALGVALGTFAVLGVNDPQQVSMAPFLLYMLVGMALGIGYQVFFLGRFGATPGKMVLGLRVVRSDGARITYLRALGRMFAEMLSGMIFCIGYIMAGFDEQKRALHDHICDTRVVKA